MKHKVVKIVPCALALSVMLGSCSSEKSECELINRHVHKYIKNVNGQIKIEKYMEDERMSVGGYNWTDNTIEVTSVDADYFKTLEKKGLFLGATNWDFLYNQMLTHPDYLEFYYYYETTEIYTSVDDDGNVTIETETVIHDGWTRDPNYWPNTGKVRLNHYMYYGYRVVNKNGKFTLEKSKEVDDIREVIDDYPLVGEDSLTKVCEYFREKPALLPSLTPDDFDTFNHPDLTNKDISLGISRTRLNN